MFRFLRKIFCSYFSILLFSKFFHIKLESIFFSDFSIFFEWNKSIIKLLIWFLLIELVNIFHIIVSALLLVCLERQWLLMSIIICTHASPTVISSCRCCPIWKINKSTLFPFFLIFYNLLHFLIIKNYFFWTFFQIHIAIFINVHHFIWTIKFSLILNFKLIISALNLTCYFPLNFFYIFWVELHYLLICHVSDLSFNAFLIRIILIKNWRWKKR